MLSIHCLFYMGLLSFAADLQMDCSLDYKGTFNPTTSNFAL